MPNALAAVMRPTSSCLRATAAMSPVLRRPVRSTVAGRCALHIDAIPPARVVRSNPVQSGPGVACALALALALGVRLAAAAL